MDIRQMKRIIGKKSCSNPLEEILIEIKGVVIFIMSELVTVLYPVLTIQQKIDLEIV